MKTRKVEAYIGKGDGKIFAGECDIGEPENFDECLSVFGSVEHTIDLAMRSVVIEAQNALRNKPKKPKTANEKAFANSSIDQQNRVLELMEAMASGNLEEVQRLMALEHKATTIELQDELRRRA